jgi:hypothetical protein
MSLAELNLGGEDKNHSSQPPELNPINKWILFLFSTSFYFTLRFMNLALKSSGKFPLLFPPSNNVYVHE